MRSTGTDKAGIHSMSVTPTSVMDGYHGNDDIINFTSVLFISSFWPCSCSELTETDHNWYFQKEVQSIFAITMISNIFPFKR